MQLCPRAVWILSWHWLSVVDGMNAHQIRTKATDGANPKMRRWNSVVRACCDTLKGLVLGFEGRFVRCAYGASTTQHRDRMNLEVTQSLNETFGRNIDFQHALYDFSGAVQ